MHNIHVWKTVTDEGEKREVRAVKFAGMWKIQAKLKGQDLWTYYDVPPLDDLRELHDVLFRKYQRRRAAYEDVVLIEREVKKREREEAEAVKTDDEA